MMNEMINIHQYQKREELVKELSLAIISDMEGAIAARGYAVLLVSGGSTPKKLFETLRTIPFTWDKVRIGLCDDRWIDPNHPDSNEKLVRETLMLDHASKAEFIGWYHEGVFAGDAEILCSDVLKNRLWPIDAAVLGMGEDAHTASLFPHNVQLKKAFDLSNDTLCISMTPATAPYDRMSLTLRALLSVEHLYLHFEGETKQKVFYEAMNGKDIEDMPIRAILHQKTRSVEVYYA